MRDRARSSELLFPVPALLLAYALTTLSPLADPETLVFAKANTDTFYVHIDYDRDPDVAPEKPWESWDQIKTDSFYVTDSGTSDQRRHVHYAHPFYAEVNGIKGSGSDYIWYLDGSSGLEAQYTATIGFDFRFGDTVSGWESANGWHLAPYPRLTDYYARGVSDGDSVDFRDYRTVGEKEVSDFVLLKLVARQTGWIGHGIPVALASPGRGPVGSPQALWIGPSARAVLTVPDAATRLRLIDAAGRSAWEAAGLSPGARLSAPAAAGTGVFRCLWLP